MYHTKSKLWMGRKTWGAWDNPTGKESTMEIGDFIEQEHTETFALVIGKTKRGSCKVLAHDFRNRVFQTTTTGWYPSPVVIEESKVPEKIIKKIEAYKLMRLPA
jgi:hypothetical protein